MSSSTAESPGMYCATTARFSAALRVSSAACSAGSRYRPSSASSSTRPTASAASHSLTYRSRNPVADASSSLVTAPASASASNSPSRCPSDVITTTAASFSAPSSRSPNASARASSNPAAVVSCIAVAICALLRPVPFSTNWSVWITAAGAARQGPTAGCVGPDPGSTG